MLENPIIPLVVLASLLGVAAIVIVVLLKRLGRVSEAAETSVPVRVASSDVPASASAGAAVKSKPPLQIQSNALFSTLSHELRTPLNGMLGIVQMLNEERDDEDLQAIEGSARHMQAVITTLVNHAKIQEEWDELPEYREWISLYELLEQLRRNLAFRAGLRGLVIVFEHQNRSLRLRGDSDHLKTILENAILGSLESVSLVEIPKETLPLKISWTADADGVKIDVYNPLETYEPDRPEKIKNVYQMTTGKHHSRLRMSYLYWAVASSLLERYQGGFTVGQNEAGGVSTNLCFVMEQMQASESAKKPVGGLSLTQGKLVSKAVSALATKLKILVAEDDPIARSLLTMVFKHMGQEADFATNGREVLDRVGSESLPYDVILMDIDMPIMDGVSASIALRNGEAGEDGTVVPIVAVTAFNTLSDESKFKRAGMDFYLPKPVRLKDLRAVLVEVIRKTGSTKTV